MQSGYRLSKRVAEVLPPGAGTCQGNVVLGWWMEVDECKWAESLARYADTYFETTASALERFAQQAIYADDEALPILYLVSHSLELALKSAYEFRRLGVSLTYEGQLSPVKNTHSLIDLLEVTSDACLCEPTCEFLEDDTTDFVKKIHQFNVGAAFRYPYTPKGKPAWADNPIVPMAILQHEFRIHGREVQGLYYRLREQLED